MTDDLRRPLGQKSSRQDSGWRLPLLAALIGVPGAFLATFLGFAVFGGDPSGDPGIQAKIESPVAQSALIASSVPASSPAAPLAANIPVEPPASEGRTITIIDGSSGERKNVIVPGGDQDLASPPQQTLLRDNKSLARTIDDRLLEISRYGAIPVAAGTLTPITAYAAATSAERQAAATSPKVAIVVTGLGVSAVRTADAIARLPAAVTLGFTPYGPDLEKLTTSARAAKHEIVLQVPMEPFDYPENDPGPQTLLTTLSSSQNIDRLHAHMGRFAGYVGIAPLMGARLVVNEAIAPILKDINQRGLGYFDDGMAARSIVPGLARSEGMPFAKADRVIDAATSAGDIDQQLLELEHLARQQGTAVGVASVLPLSVERIVVWAKELKARGIVLVPLTTIMLKSGST